MTQSADAVFRQPDLPRIRLHQKSSLTDYSVKLLFYYIIATSFYLHVLHYRVIHVSYVRSGHLVPYVLG